MRQQLLPEAATARPRLPASVERTTDGVLWRPVPAADEEDEDVETPFLRCWCRLESALLPPSTSSGEVVDGEEDGMVVVVVEVAVE
jgi:hypothetical protein